ncbi:MAG: dephospho-CoA kinase [Gemmatimonadales bacterium]
MLNVALTGNVAAGKSTVLNWFAEWGARIIDADALVREAQQPGTDTMAAIARRFGKQVLKEDGSLDRAALRGIVLADDKALASLNAIIHPAVRRQRADLAREAADGGVHILVNDIPLLFEVLDPRDFDLVVLVDAPTEVRRRRLMELRGLSEDDTDRLIASQMPAELKRPRSDLIIENDGTEEQLRERALAAWEQIQQRAVDSQSAPG